MYHIKFLLVTVMSLVRLVCAGFRVSHYKGECEFYRFYWKQIEIGKDCGINFDYVQILDMADIDRGSLGHYTTMYKGKVRRLGVAEDN